MFELTVHHEFCAAHAIVMAGVREPVHGHNWRVAVTVQGPGLDSDGLLCDFHRLEADVRAAAAPFHNADLNAVPPFDRVNPTAERVAQHLAECVSRGLPATVRVAGVSVTEAPGCVAVFRPETP